MDEPYAVHEVRLDHLDPFMIQQISPAQNLNLPVSDYQLLQTLDLILTGVQLLRGVLLPLV